VLVLCAWLIYSSIISIKESFSVVDSWPKVSLNPEIVNKVQINGKCGGMDCAGYCLSSNINKQECIDWCNSNPIVCQEVVNEISKVANLRDYA
jgi:hypothetical protein